MSDAMKLVEAAATIYEELAAQLERESTVLNG